MKKLFIAVVALALLMVFPSCSGKKGQDASSENVDELALGNGEELPDDEDFFNGEEESLSSSILKPGTTYKATIGKVVHFPSHWGIWSDDEKTTLEIVIYNDGGATSIWTKENSDVRNLEGRWESRSQSYHDVKYDFIVYSGSFEGYNNDFILTTYNVEIFIDSDLNFYNVEEGLFNHKPIGKFVSE